jgi:hypothetical protein
MTNPERTKNSVIPDPDDYCNSRSARRPSRSKIDACYCDGKGGDEAQSGQWRQIATAGCRGRLAVPACQLRENCMLCKNARSRTAASPATAAWQAAPRARAAASLDGIVSTTVGRSARPERGFSPLVDVITLRPPPARRALAPPVIMVTRAVATIAPAMC